MRTLSAVVMLAGLLIVSDAGLMRAEDGPGKTREYQKEKGEHGAKMKEKLGLSDDQAGKLKSLRESQRETVKPLREKQQALKKTLEDQLKAKAPDAEIQATMNEMKANRQAMREQMENFQKRRESILTPTQQAKMMTHEMKHRGGRGGHQKDHMKDRDDRQPEDKD